MDKRIDLVQELSGLGYLADTITDYIEETHAEKGTKKTLKYMYKRLVDLEEEVNKEVAASKGKTKMIGQIQDLKEYVENTISTYFLEA